MHSRFVSISAIAVIGFLPIILETEANAEHWFEGQEILVECPVWEWEPSQIPGIVYELCFDDVDHCAVAEIGDAICIPSLGSHDVWVTAVDYQSGEPAYYDGDIVPVMRLVSSDFDGDGRVGFSDFGLLTEFYGEGGGSPADLDGDGVVGFLDFSQFVGAYGKCVNQSGTVYQQCL